MLLSRLRRLLAILIERRMHVVILVLRIHRRRKAVALLIARLWLRRIAIVGHGPAISAVWRSKSVEAVIAGGLIVRLCRGVAAVC